MTADSAEQLGDRHHRPDPIGKLRDHALHRAARVRLRVSPALCAGRVGQLGAWLSINLLARLEGMVEIIELECKPEPTHPALSVLRPNSALASTLPRELAEVGHQASAGRIAVTEPTNNPVAMELILGGAEVEKGNAASTVWCFGRGWLASAGALATVARAEIVDDSNPLGMYLAVCYGVGEVFKALKGFKADQSYAIHAIYSSLWSGTSSTADWSEVEDGPQVGDLRVPPTYLVGAGAVGQAALLCLITSSAGADFLTAIDRDSLDLTNRNRYVLTFNSEDLKNKAFVAAAIAAAAGSRAHGEPLHWQDYFSRPNAHPDSALAANEHDLRYALVLSCVDKNRPRHEIQRMWPRDLLGASTESLRAQAVYYDMRTSTACLGCHNPVLPFDQVLDELRGAIKGIRAPDRPGYLQARGIAVGDVEAALRYLDDPSCGEAGQNVLQKFAEDGPPAFAVGFVSMAAGLLLSRHWFRLALYGPTGVTPPDKHYLSINFFNGQFMWREEKLREGCFCVDGGRTTWRSLWG